jgi:glyoxylase-like metal-dependent hydrolase (beta-lactamase superfamily II)
VWHPRTAFGARVGSYALRVGQDTLLIDPLWPAETDDAALDAIVGGGRELLIAITIPYHVRDAVPAWERWGADHPTRILGHPAARRRLPDAAPFRAVAAGDELPHGLRAFAVGSPRRNELPLYVPDHDALVFGDVVVTDPDGGLAVWIQHELTEQRRVWFRDRYRPTLQPLLEPRADRVLTTHGAPVIGGGVEALQRALDRGPWYHRPT